MTGKGEHIRSYNGNLSECGNTSKEVTRRLNETENMLNITAPAFAEIYLGYGNYLYIRKELKAPFEAEQGIWNCLASICGTEVFCGDYCNFKIMIKTVTILGNLLL